MHSGSHALTRGFCRLGAGVQGKSSFVKLVSGAEIKFPNGAILGISQKIPKQQFARREVGCVQIKGVLVQQKLAVGFETEIPGQWPALQFERAEAQSLSRSEFLDQRPKKLLKIPAGAPTL